MVGANFKLEPTYHIQEEIRRRNKGEEFQT